MKFQIHEEIADTLTLKSSQVEAVLALFADGSTVPFIARYRKEVTLGLDEIAIAAIRDENEKILRREERRQAILTSILEQGKLDPDLESKILKATSLAILEDLYLPYKQKRKTRASIAREKGYGTLADQILKGSIKNLHEAALAAGFNPDEACAGAQDIIAEILADHAELRNSLRQASVHSAHIETELSKEGVKHPEQAKFKDYHSYSESAAKAPSHRILAALRGEALGILKFRITCDPDLVKKAGLPILDSSFIKGINKTCSTLIQDAYSDAYTRLLAPSLENEIKNRLKDFADREAIAVFSTNLRSALMDPPFGSHPLIALDPGFRTGCKVAVLDNTGKLLECFVIYPHEPQKDRTGATAAMRAACARYKPRIIVVGNGTAGRETKDFLSEVLEASEIYLGSETGASVYSASELAREEFPDLDLTFRSAISIGRRFMDPLSELVKIDPKALGLGQYQHDVDQKALKRSLDDTIISCVNAVGVDLNTASPWLLSYVAGLSPKLAKAILEHRNKKGMFTKRQDLLEVKGLGPKTYEQAAGFLRIRNAKNPLDSSSVHPESYSLVEDLSAQLGCTVSQLVQNMELITKAKTLVTQSPAMQKKSATYNDILAELVKPGRDPRSSFENLVYDAHIRDIKDLAVGMLVWGHVTNVTAFGAFIDLGVHVNALAHISQLSDSYVSDPHQLFQTGQKVQARILDLDIERKRIAVSLKKSKTSTSD